MSTYLILYLLTPSTILQKTSWPEGFIFHVNPEMYDISLPNCLIPGMSLWRICQLGKDAEDPIASVSTVCPHKTDALKATTIY